MPIIGVSDTYLNLAKGLARMVQVDPMLIRDGENDISPHTYSVVP